MNKLLLSAAVALVATTAAAHDVTAEEMGTKVKCLGIAKAGKNDCKSANGSHSCAGQATTDDDPNEWNFAESAEACTEAGGTAAE